MKKINRVNAIRAMSIMILSLFVMGIRDARADVTDLFSVPLQDLGSIEITSVSKHLEKASKVASAIFVVTKEDIRRSRATSIPEILRVVPGLEVTRINTGSWAVTARGFNAVYANKLLVLVDGRSVYSTLDGGVYWDQTDLVIDDIERIEVIRGPGATVWGVNAVNGVINIITKSPADQEGQYISLGG